MNFNINTLITVTTNVAVFMLLICVIYYAVVLLIKPKFENLMKLIAIVVLTGSIVFVGYLLSFVVTNIQLQNQVNNQINKTEQTTNSNNQISDEVLEGFGIDNGGK